MIRRFLLSATALMAVAGSSLAADLPYRQAPPAYAPPLPIFTWTGVYIGGQIGYAWGGDSYTVYSPVAVFSDRFGPNGVIGGAHLGYNAQFNQFVVGLEGDIEGTGVNKTYASGFITYGTRSPVQGSVRARAGLALDRALIYVTGGGAFAGFTNTYSGVTGTDSFSKTRAGWTVGGGIEFAVTNNWSIRAEYRYADFGTFQDYIARSSIGSYVRHRETENAVRAGFSYKFDTAPSVARY
jgi:outer membrane immunogenic protein